MGKLYMNKPQLTSHLMGAVEETAIWGRGTGKSSGLIAPRSIEHVFAMPRSLGVYIASSYQQLLTRTLPGVLEGWERMGYKQDRDFVVGHFAPKKWRWELPYTPPLKAQYFIHFRNGSGIAMASMDRPGSVNGLNVDWVIGDEAKFLDERRFTEELVPTLRGNKSRWGEMPNLHSILLCSDMPTMPSGMWILSRREEYLKPENYHRAQLVLASQQKIIEIKSKLSLSSYSDSYKKKLQEHMSWLTRSINSLRVGDDSKGIKPLAYYSEASSLDNIDVLGIGYIEKMKRNLPWHIFKTSILNQPLKKITNGFYPDLNESTHGYERYDDQFLDSIGFDLRVAKDVDSRQDGDLMQTEPLEMALDYGSSFNCCVIGQDMGMEFRLVNAIYVKHPDKLRDLAKKFKRYYRHHKCKKVRFYYDHTAIGTNAVDDVVYWREWADLLEKDDEFGVWKVHAIYVGQQPTHHFRYEMWGKILTESDPSFPRFRYNKRNCEQWAISCMMAPMKVTAKGYEKDKSSEKKTSSGEWRVPQQEATHLSDAGDTLLYSILKERTHSTGSVPSPSLFS